MTFNALLPPPDMSHHDEDVFNMDFAELGDFLGEMEFHPEMHPSTIAMAAQPISPESATALTNGVHAPHLPFPPSLQNIDVASPSEIDPSVRVSPASSVAEDNSVHSDNDEAFSSHVPETVVTTSNSEIQVAHLKNQKAATTKSAISKDDVVAAKKYRRRERNREHAKRCRSRKKNYLKSLEDSVVDLKKENEQLRRLMMTKFSREELAAFMKDRPTITPVDRFAASLMKKPEATPLATATDYLQSLREGCGTD
ncbi:bZIP transcription factor [Nitzschia inconspicua]|uniref:BZIP transcription factor n=1 Tax=Nitzschia inconspicua TaxID=303405 RepID=A0A9K3KWN6_9STRA|nr:bZIP transcription factor [Nitzschia inconspicua]